MAERPPINPFANLQSDPTAARLATDSANNLARTRQALGVQRMVDASKIANTNANNLAKMHQLGITSEIPSLLRSGGKINPEVLKTMIRRSNIRELKDTMPIAKIGAEMGKHLPSFKGESLGDAGNIFRRDLTPGPTLGERTAKAGILNQLESNKQRTVYEPDKKGTMGKSVYTDKAKTVDKTNTPISKDVSNTIIASVLKNLNLVEPKVISHIKDKGAIIEHTVNGKRVQSPVTYNNPKP